MRSAIDIIALLCVLPGLSAMTQRVKAGFTDLVEDSQVLTLQRSGFLSETLKGKKKKKKFSILKTGGTQCQSIKRQQILSNKETLVSTQEEQEAFKELDQ